MLSPGDAAVVPDVLSAGQAAVVPDGLYAAGLASLTADLAGVLDAGPAGHGVTAVAAGAASAAAGARPVTVRPVTALPRAARPARADAARASAEAAEVAVLARLLRGLHADRALCVGSDHDRFRPVLDGCAAAVAQAGPGPLDVADGGADLVVAIGALDDCADPAGDLAEIARVLRPGGIAVIGAANASRGASRRAGRRRPAVRTHPPARPADRNPVREPSRPGGLPGCPGHHPERLMLEMAVCGLQTERLLSVPGLSAPVLRRVLPRPARQAAEFAAQVALAAAYRGRSMFYLTTKRDLA